MWHKHFHQYLFPQPTAKPLIIIDVERTISYIRGNEASIAPPRYIEVPLQNQKSEGSRIGVLRV